MKNLKVVVLLCAVGVGSGAVNAAQLAGGGIGAVIGPQAVAATAAPALRVAERSLPDALPVSVPLAVAQPRPWGGLKLDLSPYLAPARRPAAR